MLDPAVSHKFEHFDILVPPIMLLLSPVVYLLHICMFAYKTIVSHPFRVTRCQQSYVLPFSFHCIVVIRSCFFLFAWSIDIPGNWAFFFTQRSRWLVVQANKQYDFWLDSNFWHKYYLRWVRTLLTILYDFFFRSNLMAYSNVAPNIKLVPAGDKQKKSGTPLPSSPASSKDYSLKRQAMPPLTSIVKGKFFLNA